MPHPLKKCLMDINLQYMYQFVDNTGQFRKWNDIIINNNPDYQRLTLLFRYDFSYSKIMEINFKTKL